MYHWFLYLSLFFFVLVFGCSEKEKEQKPTIFPRETPTHTNAQSTMSSGEVYVFAGDSLYAVQVVNGNTTLIGTGWAGTEVATVYDNDIYAVQGGHLWKYDLFNGAGADLGPDWGGTECMTNSNVGPLFAIQGGKLWKINTPYGSWVQLGNSDWNNTQGMTYQTDPPRLFVKYRGLQWEVNPKTGTWTNYYPIRVTPGATIIGNSVGDDEYGISVGLNGAPVGSVSRGDRVYSCQQSWVGATSIALSEGIEPLLNSNSVRYLFILKDGQITQGYFDESQGSFNVLRTIPISKPYLLVSSQAR